jgi:hypothetical protein
VSTVTWAAHRACKRPAVGRVAGGLMALALVFPTAACTAAVSSTPAKAGAAALRTESDAALVRIEALIGEPRCSDDTHCRVAGLGHLPCGGPEQYRAWSAMATDGRALADLLARYADARRQLHEAVGAMSTCEVRPAPAVQCRRSTPSQAGRCELTPSRGAGVR